MLLKRCYRQIAHLTPRQCTILWGVGAFLYWIIGILALFLVIGLFPVLVPSAADIFFWLLMAFAILSIGWILLKLLSNEFPLLEDLRSQTVVHIQEMHPTSEEMHLL